MIVSKRRATRWLAYGGGVSLLWLWACGSTANTGASSDDGGSASGGSSGGGLSSGGGSGGGTGSGGSGSSSGGKGSSGSGSSGGGSSGGGSSSGSGGSGGGDAASSGSSSGSSSGGLANGPPSVQSFDTNCLGVPDPDVAASDSLVGMVGQWTAYFYKKDGTADHQYTWQALQGSLISDTHIIYDVTSKRWFMTTILQNVTGAAYGVQVMVSSDATASSWQASVPATDSQLIDNPQPTITSDKVLLVFHGNCAWVVDKTDLYNGNASVVQPTSCNLMSADNWVAVKYGGTPPATAYAVTLADASTLSWLSVDGTQAANNINLQVHNITIPMVNEAPLWGNGGVTVNGDAIEAGEVKAMFQNGHIYWAKTTTCGGSTCERLFDIDTTANTATTHDFAMNNNQLWFGVPGVDYAGNVWMLASASTTQGPIGLALMGVYASGKSYDPNMIVPGTAQINNGSASTRWGDYYSAAQDPTDGSTWMIGQYGGGPAALNPESNAGCRVVHVTPQ